MEMSGELRLEQPPARAFLAVLDEGVLARSIPGCKTFTQVGERRYQLVAELGVAGVGGRYHGALEVRDMNPPESMRLLLEMTGGPGSVSATIGVQLEPDGSGSRLRYHGESEVGGKLAGIGQRMLDGVAKMIERQFMVRLGAEVAEWSGDQNQRGTTS